MVKKSERKDEEGVRKITENNGHNKYFLFFMHIHLARKQINSQGRTKRKKDNRKKRKPLNIPVRILSRFENNHTCSYHLFCVCVFALSIFFFLLLSSHFFFLYHYFL